MAAARSTFFTGLNPVNDGEAIQRVVEQAKNGVDASLQIVSQVTGRWGKDMYSEKYVAFIQSVEPHLKEAKTWLESHDKPNQLGPGELTLALSSMGRASGELSTHYDLFESNRSPIANQIRELLEPGIENLRDVLKQMNINHQVMMRIEAHARAALRLRQAKLAVAAAQSEVSEAAEAEREAKKQIGGIMVILSQEKFSDSRAMKLLQSAAKAEAIPDYWTSHKGQERGKFIEFLSPETGVIDRIEYDHSERTLVGLEKNGFVTLEWKQISNNEMEISKIALTDKGRQFLKEFDHEIEKLVRV